MKCIHKRAPQEQALRIVHLWIAFFGAMTRVCSGLGEQPGDMQPCRAAKLEEKAAGSQLFVAGTVLLVAGSLRRHQKSVEATEHVTLTRVGPCFISGGPLAFMTLTDVKVSLRLVVHFSTMAT